jgi:hypothetical protein
MDINRNNYEPFFLLYLDRELNPTDKHAVEKFLSENIDLQKEFAQLQQTIFTQEDLIFEPKELLFREEEKRRIVPLYWARIAAAILVILTTGLFVITEITKNHGEKIGGNHQPAIANTQSKQDPVYNNSKKKDVTKEMVAPYELADKKSTDKTLVQKKRLKNTNNVSRNVNNNLVENSNTDQANTAAVATDESPLVIQKSNTALEIQQNDNVTTNDSKQVPIVAGATALVIVSANLKDQPKKEDIDLKESDYKTDNSISVIALDDRNKSITGFFKKLTKTNPENNKTANTRKLHVSVFQFSY